MGVLIGCCVCTQLINLAASLSLAGTDGPMRGSGGGLRVPRVVAPDPEAGERRKVKLFIAIGSNPAYARLRRNLRQTWITWVREAEPGLVELRFFTEATNETIHERDAHGDIVFQDIPGGHENYMSRFHFQAAWSAERYDFDYYLRLDDDGFLCVPRLLADLERVPSEKFFWGKYWCKRNRARADENFMLFSRDIVDFFLQTWGMFRAKNECTFAAHFGMWQHFMDLAVLDDQHRIDAQQGYLTSWMHTDADASSVHATVADYAGFCANYVWAHHVNNPQVIHEVFRHTDWDVLLNTPTQADNPMKIGLICDGKGASHTEIYDPASTCITGVNGTALFPVLMFAEGYNFGQALRQQD